MREFERGDQRDTDRPSLADKTDAQTYVVDGTVCLRGVYYHQVITQLFAAWDRVSAGPVASGLNLPGAEHREMRDSCNIISRPSDTVDAPRDFILESAAPALLGTLLNVRAKCEEGDPALPFATMPRGERPKHRLFPVQWWAGA